MNEAPKSIPLWILIVSAIFALLEMGVAISLWFAPESVLETFDFTAGGMLYLVRMWAVRQFAIGFAFAFATFKKSVPMLTVTYLFFLVMFLGDLAVGVSQRENPLVISAVVMCAISTAMLFVLNKKKV